MNDKATSIALNPAAPAPERFDAQAELSKAVVPRSLSDLIPREDIQPVIDWIKNDLAEQDMMKSLPGNKMVPFPSRASKKGAPGMQSVWIDDRQIAMMGEYYEKPTPLGFDAMREMVDQTPILSSVVLTRIRQVQRFCRVRESDLGEGFEIRLRDRTARLGDDEKQSIDLLQSFFTHCGWQSNPRQRLRLKRDDFPSFMAKMVRDTLTLDSAPIETEWKRDHALGLDGLYAVDGATIRLCTEEGYKGDDEIFALQVVQGMVRSAYTYDDLIYVPRNPRTDVLTAGYGLSETELLVRTVTGFLNAMTYNQKYFDSNSIPKGLLHLVGDYGEQDLSAFKRYWSAMVRGVDNHWNMPFLVSKSAEAKATWENFGVDVNEMMFARWMTFLASLICAIYSISPDEINFESFSASKSSLSGSDTEEKLAASSDKGLKPLLAYFENIFTDFIVTEFSDKYVFRWAGLDEEDEDKRHEMRKLTLTVNEARAEEGRKAVPWGDAPLNPVHVPLYQAMQQQAQEDYGDPDGEDENGDDASDGAEPGDGEGDGRRPPDGASAAAEDDAGADQGRGMQKSFGLPPVFVIEP